MKTSLTHTETAMLILRTAKHLQITYENAFVIVTGIHSTDEFTLIIYVPLPDAKTLLELRQLNATYHCTMKVNGAAAFSNEVITLDEAAEFYKDIKQTIKDEKREHNAYIQFERIGKFLTEL